MEMKRYSCESLSSNLFLSPGTWDLFVFTLERRVCLVVNDICCWTIFDVVKELFKQPIDVVLSPIKL